MLQWDGFRRESTAMYLSLWRLIEHNIVCILCSFFNYLVSHNHNTIMIIVIEDMGPCIRLAPECIYHWPLQFTIIDSGANATLHFCSYSRCHPHPCVWTIHFRQRKTWMINEIAPEWIVFWVNEFWCIWWHINQNYALRRPLNASNKREYLAAKNLLVSTSILKVTGRIVFVVNHIKKRLLRCQMKKEEKKSETGHFCRSI